MIFAWSLYKITSYESNSDLTYHENRPGSMVIPLLSYTEPITEDNFTGFDQFKFRVNDVHD